MNPIFNSCICENRAKNLSAESALADSGASLHGVRKYESAYGRFTGIDPLWEQYAGWTPYHYCRNNPVMLVDEGGDLVKAVDHKSQQAVIQTVSTKLQKFVRFNDGVLDYKYMKQNMPSGMNVNNNFAVLSRLGEQPELITVEVTDAVVANDKTGTKDRTMDFYSEGKSDYEKSLSSYVWADGMTVFPSGTGESIQDDRSSKDGNINVFININGQKKPNIVAAHELYSHVRAFFIPSLWGTHKLQNEKPNKKLNKMSKDAEEQCPEYEER